MGWRLHKLRDQRGQALVEFAIILPIVLLILLGVVAFGLAFNAQNNEANLANLAIRLADVNLCTQCNAGDGNQQISKYIVKQADTKQLTNDGLTICFRSPPGSPAADPANPKAGDPVQVILSSNFKWFHYTGLNFGTTPIVARVTGRLEQDYNGSTYVLNSKYNSATGLATSDPNCA
jgi:hypothetical protein